MTLKDLVTAVSFDELLPYLKEFVPKHLDNIYAFREAYDRLRGMEVAPGVIESATIECHGAASPEAELPKVESSEEEKWINVSNLGNDDWENELAKQLVIKCDAPLPEIAMRCLWEITYWGFSPKEISAGWDKRLGLKKSANKYELALDKLEESIWRHQTPRKHRCKGPDGERLINGDDIFLSDKPMNRAKRKRAYRQEKRHEYLSKMAARENLILMISGEGSSFVRSEVDFLLGVEYGMRYDYYSVTADSNKRLGYILESISKYQELDLAKYNNAVIALHSSSHHLPSKEAIEEFRQTLRDRIGFEDILFGTIICDSDDEELQLTLLLNKK